MVLVSFIDLIELLYALMYGRVVHSVGGCGIFFRIQNTNFVGIVPKILLKKMFFIEIVSHSLLNFDKTNVHVCTHFTRGQYTRWFFLSKELCCIICSFSSKSQFMMNF